MDLLIKLVMIIGVTVAQAAVFSTLWSWFVVTNFGVGPLGLPSAIGVMMIVGLLNARYVKGVDFYEQITFKVFKTVTALAIGFVALLFV